MELLTKRITLSEIRSKYMTVFEGMIKADVDIQRRVIALDAELHADLEMLLLDGGSLQEDIWGINLYPDKPYSECIEYTSLINIRPSQNNCSMEVESFEIRQTIKEILLELIDFGA